MKKMIIEKDGIKVDINYIGTFTIPDIDKEYIIYGIMDNNESNDNGKILIGEVINEDGMKKVVGIKKEEEALVVAFYKEIATQLGGE